MASVKVRTKFRPDQETEMPAADAETLRAQGLLADCEAAADPAAPAPEAAPKTAAKPAARKDS